MPKKEIMSVTEFAERAAALRRLLGVAGFSDSEQEEQGDVAETVESSGEEASEESEKNRFSELALKADETHRVGKLRASQVADILKGYVWRGGRRKLPVRIFVPDSWLEDEDGQMGNREGIVILHFDPENEAETLVEDGDRSMMRVFMAVMKATTSMI
jgi:hypothetical protein